MQLCLALVASQPAGARSLQVLGKLLDNLTRAPQVGRLLLLLLQIMQHFSCSLPAQVAAISAPVLLYGVLTAGNRITSR
jgi:hypothetical protein